MMGFGLIFIVFFWIIVVLGAIWIGKLLLNKNDDISGIFSGAKENSAHEILKRRYARGEITREEFEAMKTEIE